MTDDKTSNATEDDYDPREDIVAAVGNTIEEQIQYIVQTFDYARHIEEGTILVLTSLSGDNAHMHIPEGSQHSLNCALRPHNLRAHIHPSASSSNQKLFNSYPWKHPIIEIVNDSPHNLPPLSPS